MSPSESSTSALDGRSVLINATSLFLSGTGTILLGGIALVFSCLRETHEFWLNSGGYPVFLRDIVLVSYYPLMLLNFCTLTGLAFALCAKPEMPRGFLKFQMLLLMLGWCFWGASVAISAKNNLKNLPQRPPASCEAGGGGPLDCRIILWKTASKRRVRSFPGHTSTRPWRAGRWLGRRPCSGRGN